MGNLKNTISPYIHEMIDHEFGLWMENHQIGLLLIPDRSEKQNPNTVLKEAIWNISKKKK